ncbi:hypothetical protein ElyMa_000139800 [Elysia marginata]|uniref:Uncharacterized protein n=1 Tax=Elysia marginata TaxID=1093978 RepID=A0AAV4EP43_9GAST|nr:hypothetical protein ElyMa_000139800 [Elysia marginata]
MILSVQTILQNSSPPPLSAAVGVLERQLTAFFNGELVTPDEETKRKAASAPTHNNGSEHALGFLDRMWRQAPNATMGFLNRKLSWLEAKPLPQKDELISFVVSEARGDRTKRLLKNKDLLHQIQERWHNVQAQRTKTKKTSVVKSLIKQNVEH